MTVHFQNIEAGSQYFKVTVVSRTYSMTLDVLHLWRLRVTLTDFLFLLRSIIRTFSLTLFFFPNQSNLHSTCNFLLSRFEPGFCLSSETSQFNFFLSILFLWFSVSFFPDLPNHLLLQIINYGSTITITSHTGPQSTFEPIDVCRQERRVVQARAESDFLTPRAAGVSRH